MKNNIKYIIIGLLVIANLILLYTNWNIYNDYKNQEIITITDTLYVEKIIKDTVPFLEYKYLDRHITDTLLVEVSDTIKEYLPVTIPISNYQFSNTLYQGSDTIKYKAHLSGYKTTLDSMYISVRYPQIIQNTSITRPNRGIQVKHGIQLGLGLGIINKKPDIYAGYGLQISF